MLMPKRKGTKRKSGPGPKEEIDKFTGDQLKAIATAASDKKFILFKQMLLFPQLAKLMYQYAIVNTQAKYTMQRIDIHPRRILDTNRLDTHQNFDCLLTTKFMNNKSGIDIYRDIAELRLAIFDLNTHPVDVHQQMTYVLRNMTEFKSKPQYSPSAVEVAMRDGGLESKDQLMEYHKVCLQMVLARYNPYMTYKGRFRLDQLEKHEQDQSSGAGGSSMSRRTIGLSVVDQRKALFPYGLE